MLNLLFGRWRCQSRRIPSTSVFIHAVNASSTSARTKHVMCNNHSPFVGVRQAYATQRISNVQLNAIWQYFTTFHARASKNCALSAPTSVTSNFPLKTSLARTFQCRSLEATLTQWHTLTHTPPNAFAVACHWTLIKYTVEIPVPAGRFLSCVRACARTLLLLLLRAVPPLRAAIDSLTATACVRRWRKKNRNVTTFGAALAFW